MLKVEFCSKRACLSSKRIKEILDFCLIYVLHLRNQDTEERLNRLENSIQTVQTTETDNTNI